MDVKQKIALITGANRGLGFEIARQLGRKKMTVLIGARNKEAGIKAAEELKAENIDAIYLLLDIDDQRSIAMAVAAVKEKFGKLDILVNNAARLPTPADSHSPSDISQILLNEYMKTNFMSPVLVTQSFLPLIRESHSGRIVNMSSSIGSVTIMSEPLHENGPKPARLAYGAAKTALNIFTIMLAKELRGTPIKVNSADPGLTQTDAGGAKATNTVEQGAKPAVWLACLDDDGPTGSFFTHAGSHVINNPW